uniref:Protein krueppel n=1 Tax=Stomoxys calcitrans TaxID=35570 RepID=A0A1I8Q337_STOCA
MDNISELTCRVCLHEQQVLINVFEELDDLQTNLSSLLEKCGDMQVEENDVFPKYLCEECTQELLIAAQFREKCIKSQKVFDEAMKVCNVDDIDGDNFNQIIEYSDGESDNVAACEDQVVPESKNTHSFCTSPTEAEEQNLNNNNEIEDNLYVVGDVVDVTSFQHNLAVQQSTPQEIASTDAIIDNVDVIEEGSCDVDCREDSNNYEVHIDLSNSSFVKALPIRSKRDKSYKCDICGAVFVQAINLQKHLQKTHIAAQYYTCDICNHWFSVEVELLKHAKHCREQNLEQDNLNENKNKSFSGPILSSAQHVENQKRCNYCERDFQTPFALRMHMRSHTGERPFPCQYCNKSFKTQSSLSAHTKRHTGQADFVCSVCGKSFYERGNLDVHMRSHTGEKPHSCSMCNKSFTRVFLLELHMRTHTGEKPYSCSFCDKSFRQRSDWKNHLSTHTGVKQFNCNFCSKGYIKRTSLAQHLRTHSAIQIEMDNDISQETNNNEHSEGVENFGDIITSEEDYPS